MDKFHKIHTLFERDERIIGKIKYKDFAKHA